MSVVLIGYRGSGKSTVGKRLADRLWQPFVDTDELIVRKAGKSIREIFEEQGEAAFRDLESTIVRDTLMLQEHVISLGGGALLREENRAALKASGHKVVYLKCDPAELYKRITADPESVAARPDLTSAGGLEEVQNLLAAREPAYRKAMSAELDVTHLSPQDAVVYIVRLL
jgi:shikimate kinase